MSEGSSVSSKNQIKGHGRRNRVWNDYQESYAGSWLLFDSIPKLSPGVMQILVGLSVIETINCLTKNSVEIILKWPNDVLVSFGGEWRKVSGILIESKSSGDDNVIVAGIGINISGEYNENFDIPVGFVKELSEEINYENINVVLNAILASNFERIETIPELSFPQLERQINNQVEKAFTKLKQPLYRNSTIEFLRILEDGSIEVLNQKQERLIIDDSESVSWNY